MKGEFYKMEYEAWDEGTDSLSLELEAAYLRICHQMYRRRGSIPDQPNTLCRIWRCHPNKARHLLNELVAVGKVIREGGLLTNVRVRQELDDRETLSTQRRDAGHTGGIRSAQSRRNALKTNDAGEAVASSQTNQRRVEERRVEQEPIGSLSEASSDAPPSPRKTRVGYPPDFETFWAGYPRDGNMSKKEAGDVWKRMSPEDREAAIRSLPAFRAYCSAHPDYRPVHANRYLKQRRYEGHIQTAERSAGQVFVAKGTPEWDAWQRRLGKTPCALSQEHRADGWWFESLWPPEEAAA